eukprot:TRINITY_DN30570_c0_g1_i3.p1 TRINITY_DN30570_c0_g1~~TRINITY_DN30570_c0_g1_i3.p1  ORF type:complete len:322 (-),score=100.60 TRINITY_DN30570_c0_g1_i3:131-1096(-)
MPAAVVDAAITTTATDAATDAVAATAVAATATATATAPATVTTAEEASCEMIEKEQLVESSHLNLEGGLQLNAPEEMSSEQGSGQQSCRMATCDDEALARELQAAEWQGTEVSRAKRFLPPDRVAQSSSTTVEDEQDDDEEAQAEQTVNEFVSKYADESDKYIVFDTQLREKISNAYEKVSGEVDSAAAAVDERMQGFGRIVTNKLEKGFSFLEERSAAVDEAVSLRAQKSEEFFMEQSKAQGKRLQEGVQSVVTKAEEFARSDTVQKGLQRAQSSAESVRDAAQALSAKLTSRTDKLKNSFAQRIPTPSSATLFGKRSSN